jgi:acetyl-CoA C-acetyltransferase
MIKKVGIASYGITKFSREDAKIESVLLKATKNLFENCSNLTQKDIDAVLVSTNNNSKYLSPILAEMTGIEPKIAHSVESLCNSGTNAIISAYSYIASGLADVVLVAGAERYDSPGQILQWDNSRGEFKHPIFWASIFTKSYKKTFSVKEEDLALVSVKNHRQAQKNPYAFSDKIYTLNDVLNSKKLTNEIRLLDCSRPCTGGASIILASENKIKEFSDKPIWITGIGQKTMSAGFTKTITFSSMESSAFAAQSALKMSKHQPNEIDVLEIHDAFSVCEPMSLESIGITEKGKGIDLVKDMISTNNSKINPRGGLIGCGHPLGATGIAQTIEIFQQLQSKAESRQIDNPKVGLIHNMSAASTSSTVLVLEN